MRLEPPETLAALAILLALPLLIITHGKFMDTLRPPAPPLVAHIPFKVESRVTTTENRRGITVIIDIETDARNPRAALREHRDAFGKLLHKQSAQICDYMFGADPAPTKENDDE